MALVVDANLPIVLASVNITYVSSAIPLTILWLTSNSSANIGYHPQTHIGHIGIGIDYSPEIIST